MRRRKEELLDRTAVAVRDRLTKEIIHWDHRAEELRLQEEAGKTPRLNSARARQRRDELTARLERRLQEIEEERRLAPLPPVAIGGALVVPAGLLARLGGAQPEPFLYARDTRRVEQTAMAAVIAAESRLGYDARDVSAERRGYDVESRDPRTGRLRFIEVKGRAPGADTVTVTRNEIVVGLNKPDDYVLAVVEVDGDTTQPLYVRRPFRREPDFGVTSVNYALAELRDRGEAPG